MQHTGARASLHQTKKQSPSSQELINFLQQSEPSGTIAIGTIAGGHVHDHSTGVATVQGAIMPPYRFRVTLLFAAATGRV